MSENGKKKKNLLEPAEVVFSDKGYRKNEKRKKRKTKKKYSSGQTRSFSRMLSKQIEHPIALDRDDSPDQLRYTCFFFCIGLFSYLIVHPIVHERDVSPDGDDFPDELEYTFFFCVVHVFFCSIAHDRDHSLRGLGPSGVLGPQSLLRG